jgi:hypothetical protein
MCHPAVMTVLDYYPLLLLLLTLLWPLPKQADGAAREQQQAVQHPTPIQDHQLLLLHLAPLLLHLLAPCGASNGSDAGSLAC